MAVDYDLVILGGTLEGRAAAWTAANLEARVALIEPEATAIEAIFYRYALIESAKMVAQSQQAMAAAGNEVAPWQPDWQWLQQRVQTQMENLDMLRSRQDLATAGVDVIDGFPEIVPSPRLSILIDASDTDDSPQAAEPTGNSRLVRARSYLLATGGQPI